MCRLGLILAAVVFLAMAPGWVLAGNKVELIDWEMDQVTAAGSDPFAVLFIKFSGLHAVSVYTGKGRVNVAFNGVKASIVPGTPPPGSVPFHSETFNTKLGSQGNGLNGLGLIQTSRTNIFWAVNNNPVPSGVVKQSVR